MVVGGGEVDKEDVADTQLESVGDGGGFGLC